MIGEPAAGEVITFYSYKGGTGRSMAMANVACLLARRQETDEGKPVLAIDWDLEAPGLHRYFEPYTRGGEDAAGLMDLLIEARDAVAAAGEGADHAALVRQVIEAIDLSKYVCSTTFPKLFLLRAGRMDEDYGTLVNTFSWTGLFAAVPQFFRLFAQRLARDYSFVLIDSRTGVTDISGICTMLMPEKLVVVFTPNRQSLTGITKLVQRARQYRQSSDDLRDLIVFPLPSRIDTSFPDLMKRWRLGNRERSIPGWQIEFQKLMRDEYALDDEEVAGLEHYFDGVQLLHVAQYAFGEPIAVVEERASDKLTLSNSYAILRDYLLRGAPWAELAPVGSAAELERKIARLEERIRVGDAPTYLAPSQPLPRSRQTGWWITAASLVFAILILVGSFYKQVAKPNNAALMLRISQLDPQSVDPATTALLLLEALPGLEGAERDAAVSRLREALNTLPRRVGHLSVPPNASHLSFSEDGRTLLWWTNPASGEAAFGRWSEREGRGQQWRAAASEAAFYDAEGKFILTTDGSSLVLWSNGERRWYVDLATLLGDGRPYRLTNDGHFVTGVIGKSMPVWSASDLLALNRRPKAVLNVSGDGWVNCRPSSDVCAITTPFSFSVADLKTSKVVNWPRSMNVRLSWDGRLLGLLDGVRGKLTVEGLNYVDVASIDVASFALVDFAFTPNGDSVVGLGRNGLYSFEVPGGKLRGLPGGDTGSQASAAFAGVAPDAVLEPLSDGRFVIRSGTRVFVASDAVYRGLRFNGSVLLQTAASRNADRLAISRRNEGIDIWDISPAPATSSDAELKTAVCQRAGRQLSKDEWAIYLPDRDYKPQCASK